MPQQPVGDHRARRWRRAIDGGRLSTRRRTRVDPRLSAGANLPVNVVVTERGPILFELDARSHPTTSIEVAEKQPKYRCSGLSRRLLTGKTTTGVGGAPADCEIKRPLPWSTRTGHARRCPSRSRCDRRRSTDAAAGGHRLRELVRTGHSHRCRSASSVRQSNSRARVSFECSCPFLVLIEDVAQL
jgi:hypothetical protein